MDSDDNSSDVGTRKRKENDELLGGSTKLARAAVRER